jgi:hypothetical protein
MSETEKDAPTCPGCTEHHLTDQHAPGDPLPETVSCVESGCVCTTDIPTELLAQAWDEGHRIGADDQMYGSITPNPHRP